MLYIIYLCVNIHIYLFIHLSRFFFYYCALCMYLLWNDFMCILLYMIMCMLLSATSTHFKWELMLYCLHCPTLNKVFLLLLLLLRHASVKINQPCRSNFSVSIVPVDGHQQDQWRPSSWQRIKKITLCDARCITVIRATHAMNMLNTTLVFIYSYIRIWLSCPNNYRVLGSPLH